MIANPTDRDIRSCHWPTCILCGNPGKLLYTGLRDRLFGALGEWNLRECSNPNCRLAWIDPMPCKENISKAYENYYTHQDTIKKSNLLRKAYYYVRDGYLSWQFAFPGFCSPWQKLAGFLLFLNPIYRASADLMVMKTKFQPGGRLLDVGCGSGEILAFLNSRGWQGVGVDFDLAAVQLARSKGLDARQGSLEAQHYLNNQFDLITMHHVIEHMYDPIALFKECYRILKPGGQIVIVTPNLGGLGHRIFGNSWRGLEPPRHLYIYSAKSLCTALERANLTIHSVNYSVKGAAFMYLQSRAIKAKDKATPGAVQERLYSILFSWYEWALLKFKADCGEELIVRATK